MAEAKVFAPGKPVGYQIPDAPKDWFNYPLNFTAVTVGTPQSQNLAIDAGSDFYLTAITAIATNNANTTVVTTNTQVIPFVTLLLTDSGSNRQLMQNPVPIPLLTGSGMWPHRLIHPRLFMRNSNIQVLVANYDPVSIVYNTLYLNFEGFRIYGS